ncbi:unnamed protein product [Aspergillus niger]|nr:hypothetical protein CBS147345_11167 [Aspergillus niger]KAI3014564.1 hypothetical protein CBS147347_11428 [Aspergillus niger]SPB49732.1 unnamed protein product [Aspergillus niger]
MPSGHTRHQVSLEAVLDFSQPFTLPPDQSRTATIVFYQLINHYNTEQVARKGYRPAALAQAVFDHVSSKDAFLVLFLSFVHDTLCSQSNNAQSSDFTPCLLYFDGFASWNLEKLKSTRDAIENFAEYIIENLLLPLRASSVKTPQPTPASLSSLQAAATANSAQRLSTLRQSCLIRDHHRCVISRKFDRREAERRLQQNGEDCKDDDGNLLRNESSDRFQFLEVAHILPHSLTSVASDNAELSDSKKNALQILNMFDHGITHLIEYPKIDSPLNALTLTHDYHQLFGAFKIYFEHTGAPYQYEIKSTEQSSFLSDPLLPVVRTLTLSPNRTIDPPSHRLLAVHRAIACIIKISGAGDYMESILRDIEEVTVKADGSTNLGLIMNLRLSGWLDTLAAC